MGDPRWGNMNATGKILEQRQPGPSGDTKAFQTLQTETNKRKDSAVTGAPAQIMAAASGGGGNPSLPVPPAQPVTPRWHKWASTYVSIGNIHNPGEDTDPNPGYAPTSAPVTIQAAYDFAVLQAIKKPGSRVLVEVHGGQWTEDVVVYDNRVDIVGIGQPQLFGSFSFPIQCQQAFVGGFVVTSNSVSAITIANGPSMPGILPSLRFKNMALHVGGTQLPALDSWRPFLFEDGTINQESDPLTPAVLAHYNGQWLSWAQIYNSKIYCYGPSMTGTTWNGIAIRVTAKTIIDALNGNYWINAITKNSGLYLENCQIFGTVIADGWNIQHRRCAGFDGIDAGIIAPGGGHAIIRGWYNGDNDTRVDGNIQWDLCNVTNRYIALFDSDQPPGAPGGGTAWYRNSNQLFNFGHGAGSFFTPANATGFIHVVDSSTPEPNWFSGGTIPTTIINSPTNVFDIAMHDLFVLQ